VGGGAGGGGAGTAAELTPCAGDEAKALVERVGAGTLLIDGQRVASAQLHPEFALFHSTEAPPTVVTAFMTCILSGNENAIYPFGQDQRLCIEKGYPSPTPVPLSAIQAGNRVAWPVGSIGYVASVSLLSSFLNVVCLGLCLTKKTPFAIGAHRVSGLTDRLAPHMSVSLPTRSPRVRLFDRPPLEEGSVFLATACVWRVAPPSVAALAAREAESGNAESGQRAVVVSEMPAVEVFGLVYTEGMADADYPFTSCFYESVAYSHFRKRHFPDYILPNTMVEASAVDSLGTARRSVVLWDAHFVEG